MDSRRWWLLAAAVPVALGCALATEQPALTLAGQLAVVGAGLLAAAVLWRSGGRASRRRGWRLLAVAPLLPVSGVLFTLANPGLDPLTLAVLRWAPTVPGYLVSIVAILLLVDRGRLRAGPRIAVEVALFFVACLVVVGLLIIGPSGTWSTFSLVEQLVLGLAVVATSAIMAAALTLLTVVEPARRCMAVVLLGGTVFLTLGRGLATSALLAGTPPVPAGIARGLMAAGLLLMALAAVLDSPRRGAARDAESGGRPASARLGAVVSSLLPQLALMAAVLTVATVALRGSLPGSGATIGIVTCVVLTVAQRALGHREEHRLNARLRHSEAYFRSVVQSSGDAVVVLDDDLRVGWASPVLERSLGTVAAELVGRSIVDAVHPDDAAALAAALQASDPVAGRTTAGLVTLRLTDAAGEWRYLEAGISDLRQVSDVGAVVLHCRDMTDRYEREQALQAVAYTDPVTGLPNRAGFRRLLSAAVEAPELPSSTLLVVELDGLAEARAAAGREVVGAAVSEIGRRLRATVRGEDVVARLGGGAFAVLAVGDAADADRLAARCHAVVEQPVTTTAGVIDLTAGIGLVDLEPSLSVDDLFDRADLAVRQAHEAGPGSSARFRSTLGEAASRRQRLRAELVGACARGELSLVFQPVVSLGEQKVTGVEALARWRHPALGEIRPSEFVPIAESSGLSGVLVRWLLEAAATAVAALPDGEAPLQLGVDVPAGYVAGGMLVADVQHALKASGLAPERLVLEIGAATVLSDDDRVALDLSTLRLMGVHVALDGFGTGSSALGHLTQLPIDVLKLDRSLVSRIDRDPQSRAMCEAIVGIGRTLNLDVVAEGVESTSQLAVLTAFGCGFAQGYLISRPMPLTALVSALDAGAEQLWPGVVSRT